MFAAAFKHKKLLPRACILIFAVFGLPYQMLSITYKEACIPKILNVLHKSCCGIDVHKKTVVICILKADEFGEYTDEIKTFSTMTWDLENLRDWLKERNCEKIAMESTGIYWIPVFNVLEGHFDIVLSNARQIKNVAW